MACMKLGSKAGLFPLLSRSGKLERLIEEFSDDEEEGCVIQLHDIPGGPNAFELAAKFCYGVKVELTSTNVVFLRCAAEYLEMTEEYGEGNLIAQTEVFFNQLVLRSWKDSIKVLQSCEDLLPYAEKLQVVKRCVDSIAMKACSDPSLFGWPMMEHGSMQSPGGSVLWNGISTGARLKSSHSDWWYEDVSVLSLTLYKRLISAMETRGIKPENIGGAVTVFANKNLPGLSRRQGVQQSTKRYVNVSLTSAPSEDDRRVMLETIESLLPMQKGVTSTSFLFGLLRTAMIINADQLCKDNLERKSIRIQSKEEEGALQSCEDVLPHAEQLQIVKRCVDSVAIKACTDPNLFGWPMMEHGSMQSPGGSVLWNGISTGARPKNASSDWWYEDVSVLSLISAMETRGIKPENIAGSLTLYAKRYLPGLNRRQGVRESSSRFLSASLASVPSEDDQRVLLEAIESLLPMQKGVTSTRFLFGLLRTAMILNASPICKSNLEKRLGMQLDQATLEDLLMPNYSYAVETLYDVDCVQRILDHFLLLDQATGGASPCSVDDGQLIGSPSLTPITMVAKLMDGYLAEVAPDVNLKLPKFQSLAAALPDYARPLDDGLYRAIDIYLKAHPWLIDSEREQLCRLMDCQKLSLEACTHAAQNERLPLRVVVQVLFFEQLQLRTSIAGCFLVSDNLDTSRPLRHNIPISNEGAIPPSALRGEGWANAVRENQVLKVGMDNMRLRVSELEKECSRMRLEIEKLGKAKIPGIGSSKKLGCRFKSQFCSTQEGAINNQNPSMGEPNQLKSRQSRHKRGSSFAE